uniref:Glucosylceramidase n=1 Tax=Acrobeloides nanus TaxID=290746 RepID=A0A914DQN0_9BILA
MVMDDQRQYLEQFADDVLGDPDANKVVDGVALHWYGDGNTLPSLLTKIHEKFPDKFLLYTEACILSPPVLGSWADGDSYMRYIINILNNWVIGFVDWNMALNPQGGPSWMGNSFGSPIIVSNTVDDKFIVPDSVIVGLNIANLPANLEAVAALTPSGQKVIVLDNRDVAANYTVSVYNDQGSYVNLNLEARSFTTLVFN